MIAWGRDRTWSSVCFVVYTNTAVASSGGSATFRSAPPPPRAQQRSTSSCRRPENVGVLACIFIRARVIARNSENNSDLNFDFT